MLDAVSRGSAPGRRDARKNSAESNRFTAGPAASITSSRRGGMSGLRRVILIPKERSSIDAGGSPRKNVVTRPEVTSMYPWMQYTDDTFQKSRKRLVIQSSEYVNPSEIETERILAWVVQKSILEPNRIKDFLREGDRKLNQMRLLRKVPL